MLATHKIHQKDFNNLKQVFMLSAWGFTMVVVSFLFLYIGHLVDGLLGTTPNFMLGFFILGLFLCMMRLYQEACIRRKDV
ncbi:MAG TPA: AtpZ/AtpI family protein [Smithella sp.]|jgi:F0F1-type ATP synthase assembly protein I|nr:AtpZ/AtpI family protein [Smithella sp.]NMC97411.1 AtpZ/AtpI family protein [Deltaproteobacteria bacterium]OQC54244.1 MAG: putative F0F1-ATPase [Deltaproteobacteria bacterium ADurb.Bin022]HNQ64344.1 AtpZ/AtpI family protein [Smithella sp.]HOE33454.1 AtpZ/AtpI family protein [Smithella sp.]